MEGFKCNGNKIKRLNNSMFKKYRYVSVNNKKYKY